MVKKIVKNKKLENGTEDPKRIYLDNAATTALSPKVFEAMKPYLQNLCGNASSMHSEGMQAKQALEEARARIAQKINANPTRLFFTSGGTESNNWALKGFALANKDRGNHIIVSSIEHDSVLEPAAWLAKQGFKVSYLKVDSNGFVDLQDLQNQIVEKTLLVSVIHANNEIGTIQDIEKIAAICHSRNVFFHTDACQSFMKCRIDVEKQGIDMLTINGHKIYGPKGIGALYVKQGIKIVPLLHGGGHELGLRSGTENVPSIAGFAEATEIITEKDVERMQKLRDYMIDRISNEIRETILNGPVNNRLCNNVNIIFKRIEGESILLRLNALGIAVSTGSACSSHSLKPSHVLLAIGVKPELAHGSIRFSLGIETTKEDIDYTVDCVKKVVADLREMTPIREGEL
ncbi:MAG: cysteine desulfurase NifS [Candidatus Diapherotrites archaeon CG08_land_8_20_14_0_20_34_12]|nr:MAG: cysteine desulfurase NifS [Candidatus Diapherotrites archaeon CG08_land_8_20_14_0_20_34_12]